MQPNTYLSETYALPNLPDAHLAVLNLDDPALVAACAATAAHVALFHRDARALRDVQGRFGDHPRITIYEDVFPPSGAEYDAALLGVPKGRGLSRAMLARAWHSLKPGGALYVSGPNHGGAKTAQTDLGALAPAQVLGHKARHRIFRAIRPATARIPAEWGTPWQPETRVFHVQGQDYTVYTQPGIFSYDHLDDGSAFLLDHLPALPAPDAPRVLDAGCGVGIIGLVAAEVYAARRVVWADSDLLAVRAMQLTRPAGDVVAADLTHDLLAPYTPFDLILCNPPFHQDHATDTAFIRGFVPRARQMLAPGGALTLVFNSFLDYWNVLEAHFAEVHFIADNGRYQILAGKHPD